jgi:DNA-binding PadR family transcriptional regulator
VLLVLDETILSAHRQEIRRGSVVLACLMALRNPGYGYALLDRLAEAGIPVDANTLYPLLRRLDEKGLLESEWNTDDTRPRKFYRTSDAGNELAALLLEDWVKIADALNELDQRGTE